VIIAPSDDPFATAKTFKTVFGLGSMSPPSLRAKQSNPSLRTG
jgi:hypothetical protein